MTDVCHPRVQAHAQVNAGVATSHASRSRHTRAKRPQLVELLAAKPSRRWV